MEVVNLVQRMRCNNKETHSLPLLSQLHQFADVEQRNYAKLLVMLSGGVS